MANSAHPFFGGGVVEEGEGRENIEELRRVSYRSAGNRIQTPRRRQDIRRNRIRKEIRNEIRKKEEMKKEKKDRLALLFFADLPVQKLSGKRSTYIYRTEIFSPSKVLFLFL